MMFSVLYMSSFDSNIQRLKQPAKPQAEAAAKNNMCCWFMGLRRPWWPAMVQQ